MGIRVYSTAQSETFDECSTFDIASALEGVRSYFFNTWCIKSRLVELVSSFDGLTSCFARRNRSNP